MKRVLLVDDDPVVLRIYRDGLGRQGFQVDTAADGLAAMKALRAARPDIIVLDLMMPRLSGVDVLRAVRSQPDLATLPVVVLSNCYMDQLAREAAEAGAQKALLKVRCTPALLCEVIQEQLEGKAASLDPSQLMAVAQAQPAAPEPKEPAPAAASSSPPAPAAPPSAAPETSEAELRAKAREELLANAGPTCATLRSLFQAFDEAATDTERQVRLQDLYRKVHFLTVAAGWAECAALAQMGCAFEALLFQLMDKPAQPTPSLRRTTALAVDFFETLFRHAQHSPPAAPATAQVLVVDDDPLSNRLTVSALQRAQFQARSTEDPALGFEWLRKNRYDLILLDIEMPGLNGFEFCRRLRLLPDYERTPVIFVTSHSDFKSRAQSVLSGGNDLIAKPVFPMELAVKTVMRLLENRLPR